ncbi:hypothetical protein PFISCL1PPCAC_24782, partial [Pristionchus fissidentatus]
MELDETYEGFYEEDEDVYFLEEEYSTSSLLSRCTHGTLDSVLYNLILTVSFAVLQRIVLTLNFLSYSTRHLLISLLGSSLLFLWDIPRTVSITMISTVICFVLFIFTPPRKFLGWIVTLPTFAALIFLETTIASDKFTYRGILMILSMKVSSLAFDLSQNKYSITVPEILGYLLNPSTLLFGPAFPFTNYRIAFIPQSISTHFWSALPGLLFLLVSLFCLLVSSCLTQIVYPEEGILRQFGDAQSFRFSHYFICFWAQGLMSVGGEESPLIVHPHQVELPRSLTQVVSLWNIPMHQYLFHYVYSRLRHLGSAVSIMGTFLVSSLLHGLNGQLSLVLLSLGLLSFTEKRLRDRLSSRLSSCIRSRPCSSCSHSHSSSSLLSISINALFSLLSVYHLIYLGMPWTGEVP